ncbi:MAG: DUF5752 family protein [Elusimicrobiota bacterium]
MEKFRFATRLNLSESLGLKAVTIEQMLEHLRHVPGSCIYHHTHRYLQQHEYLSPEPPNDFAYWVAGVLGEDELGEKLASIDIMQFKSIRELREKIISVIEYYIEKYPQSKLRFARPGREFHFIKSISFIIPTEYAVSTLEEFADALEKIDINSIYFHMFEARLRLENKSNDFSNWIETRIGDRELAKQISRLDPYTYALDDLRKTIIKIVREKRES